MRQSGRRILIAGTVGLSAALLSIAYNVVQYGSSLPYIDWLEDGHGRGFFWILVLLGSPLVMVVGFLLWFVGRRRERQAK